MNILKDDAPQLLIDQFETILRLNYLEPCIVLCVNINRARTFIDAILRLELFYIMRFYFGVSLQINLHRNWQLLTNAKQNARMQIINEI